MVADLFEPYRKRVFCADLDSGEQVDEVFCVTRVSRKVGRSGPFLSLEFADRSGRIPGVAWDNADALAPTLVEGAFVRVRGIVTDYRGQPQIQVEAAEPAPQVDPGEYLPRAPVSGSESVAEIRRLAESITEPFLRQLVVGLLDDPQFVERFSVAPAAKVNHHAYVGGLAEHTRSVMNLCELAAGHYPDLDRDLLLAGAFLHDLGKIDELAVEPGFPYTEAGSLLGHIALGYAYVRERIAAIDGFPPELATDVAHLVLSHQGELEWGSPVKPQTLEAIVLHHLDNLDSKVTAARAHLDNATTSRTGYVRSLQRSLFRRPRDKR
jgi:3'-5' exoribonuclease